MIQKFLDDFYETLSFEQEEQFKADKFRTFFLSDSILMESINGVFRQKNIDEHISEFEYAIKEYPQLFSQGFHEEQTEYTFIENDNCILVSSKFQKSYCRNGEEVIEKGINNMLIVRDNSAFKIASILW
jgi:hypothetical protein